MPSNDRRLPRARQRIFEAILVCVSLLLGYVVVELIYRSYLYYNYAIQADYPVTTVDTRLLNANVSAPGNIWGPYPPNTVFTLKKYNSTNRLLHENRIHINNVGWVSHYDYIPSKPSNEFRIAVLGASLTASITNEFPWPDALQRHLNADRKLLQQLGVERISVLNFGTAGAYIHHILQSTAPLARRYSPDLVLYNFATSDVGLLDSKVKLVDLEDEPFQSPDLSKPLTSNYRAGIIVDRVEIGMSCMSGKKELSNPNCALDATWYVPPDYPVTAENLAEIKREVARRLLLHRALLTWQPLLLLEILGSPVIPRAQAAEATKPAALDIDPRIATFIKGLEKLRRPFPNMRALHNPLYWNKQADQGPLLQALVSAAKANGFEIIEMDNLLPTHLGEREWRQWYIYDGHWSDRGAEVYGAAVARAIRNSILAIRSIAVPERDTTCSLAFAAFRNAQASKMRLDRDATWINLEAAVSQLPSDALDRYAQAQNYADCGFIAELWAERSIALEEMGDTLGAANEWKQAWSLGKERLASFLGERAAARLKRGDKQGAKADLDEMIRLDPTDVRARIQRSHMLIAMNEFSLALPDIEFTIQALPDELSHFFNRAQVRFHSADYLGAIADVNVILRRMPNNAGAYLLRSGANQKLGRLDSALSDIDAAIRLMPEQAQQFKPSREIILNAMHRRN